MHDKKRYLFIDLLRFLAVIVMLQGHTFDALLSASIKSHSLYYIHDFFHGFVAPMFLFASGVAFGVSTFKKWEEFSTLSKAFAKRAARFCGLILLGYALHLPYFSIHKILYYSTSQAIASFLQVDALHCIAVTLLIVQIAVLFVRQEKTIAVAAGVIALLIALTSPLLWSISLSKYFPLWFVSYINVENNSWFPLFPWSAYIFGGISFAYLFVNAKEHHHAVRLMQRAVAIGTGCIFIAVIVANIPLGIYPAHDFWKVNPAVITARFGFILLVLSGLFFAEHAVRLPSALPSVLGRESLFIYIINLLLLYGSVINNGLQFYFGSSLTINQAFFVFILLFLTISSFAYGWHFLKTNYRGVALFVRILVLWLLLFYFFTKPY